MPAGPTYLRKNEEEETFSDLFKEREETDEYKLHVAGLRDKSLITLLICLALLALLSLTILAVGFDFVLFFYFYFIYFYFFLLLYVFFLR